MERHYEDGLGIGREESPGIEHTVQDEVARTLKELLETKGLYQNLRIDEAIFETFRAKDLVQEFQRRPIVPHSRGEGDAVQGLRGRGGSQPLGTPRNEVEAGFYLPNVNLECPRCRRSTTFLSMLCSERAGFDSPYPKLAEETEQVYTLYYRCAVCRDKHIVFQVLRKGLRFQLTGRSIPFRPSIEKEWPKGIRKIIEDAHVAAAENDLPAAYYHLRTALEFHLKEQLGLQTATKIDGCELCDRYNAQTDARLKSGFPSVVAMYSELSDGLHTRAVATDGFIKLCADFLAHLRAKELFAEYAAP